MKRERKDQNGQRQQGKNGSNRDSSTGNQCGQECQHVTCYSGCGYRRFPYLASLRHSPRPSEFQPGDSNCPAANTGNSGRGRNGLFRDGPRWRTAPSSACGRLAPVVERISGFRSTSPSVSSTAIGSDRSLRLGAACPRTRSHVRPLHSCPAADGEVPG